MSVKTMLPILGVGSAALVLGVAAVRRNSARRAAQPNIDPATRRDRPSGIQTRAGSADELDDGELGPVVLTSEFWDAAPESDSRLEEALDPAAPPGAYAALGAYEAYDAVDTEDLTAQWLSRATQAPAFDEPGSELDIDDPAEIPADSLSMISQASRDAAAFDGTSDDDDDTYER
jgi:hypothetical protein